MSKTFNTQKKMFCRYIDHSLEKQITLKTYEPIFRQWNNLWKLFKVVPVNTEKVSV